MLSMTPNAEAKIVRRVEYPQRLVVSFHAAANWSARVWHGEGTRQAYPDEYPVDPTEGKVMIGIASINKPPSNASLNGQLSSVFLIGSP